MVDLSYAELASDLSTQSSDTLRNAANAAGDLVCSVYEAYPTGILPSIGSTPISDLTDGLLRRICAPRNKLPPDRAVPFSGGQCACVSYNVSYSVTNANGQTFSSGTTILGPVTSVTVEKTGFNSNGDVQLGVITRGGSAACGGLRTTTDLAGSTPPLTLNSVTVTRADGQPDNCGNPQPQYETDDPSISFTFSPTIKLGGQSVTVPVTIIPTLFTPVTIFRPELNVDVGGINVNFSLGGVSFSPSINPTTNITLPSTYPKPLPPTPKPPTTSDCPDVDLSPILVRFDDVDDQLDEIQACACPPELVIKTTDYAAADSRVIPLPERTIGVRILVTEVGPRVRSQYGNANAPDVYFIGWHSFGRGGLPGDRTPVSHLSNFYFAPEFADSFSYTLTGGSTGSLRVFYLDEP